MKLLFTLFFLGISLAYEVGESVSISHQNMQFDICFGSDLDPNNDAVFTFSEYNGDMNGGQYYVILLEMGASW